MNRNINKAFKLTTLNNYFGYYLGFYISTFKRPHGSWCCFIGKNGEWLFSEGKYGTSLRTIKECKKWANIKN